ncbi:hypothetical protein PPL_07786 [Heterostelium album PN500]|uniref:Uncharacterized protein n=1 Tax=Heterostelium pallidum (strain ATCC 26659 / Pp 5 / PN500) TaxID=670386 RepID=D3BGY4_HETP5|nr:hypothetical protein PPL_07786 [Heterostelium album PN500]EFA79368.1 hypothetical protein PPL_07786 [Heterostelium album PN500]|eukprot:XP_020431489.1 hypothetical protein PPL_07786 [Heterostelium album PN500]
MSATALHFIFTQQRQQKPPPPQQVDNGLVLTKQDPTTSERISSVKTSHRPHALWRNIAYGYRFHTSLAGNTVRFARYRLEKLFTDEIWGAGI